MPKLIYMNIKFSELPDSFYQFINAYAKADTTALKLKFADKNIGIPLDFALTQIELRRKNYAKLSRFISNDRFIFPNSISSEQSSDELVAEFNASIAGCRKNIVDMTAGLGIDSLSMALNGNKVTSIEMDVLKCDALEHNSSIILKDNDLKIHCADSIEFCKEILDKTKNGKYPFDVVFIDPARRDPNHKRTYSFCDCQPDIILNYDLILKIAPRILIKASPLLDINKIEKQLPDIKRIYVVSSRGECKEILVEINAGSSYKGVSVVEIFNDNSRSILDFSPVEMCDTTAPIITKNELNESKYLYEPNPGLMKLTAYGALCRKFPNIKKVSKNTSLYISDILYEDFPGRVMKIVRSVNRNDLKSFKGERLNVTVRNYPVSASELAKKLKVKEGYDMFLYAFRAFETSIPMLLLTKKIKGFERIKTLY